MGTFVFELVDSEYELSEVDVIQLQRIFSDPAFKSLFHGKKMDLKEIKKYLEWAKASNSKETLYLYLIKDENNKIVAGFDLQRKNEEEATIGFWKETNSTVRMYQLFPDFVKIAKNHRFSLLDAYCEQENHKATALLDRLKFANKGIVEERTKKLVKFMKVI